MTDRKVTIFTPSADDIRNASNTGVAVAQFANDVAKKLGASSAGLELGKDVNTLLTRVVPFLDAAARGAFNGQDWAEDWVTAVYRIQKLLIDAVEKGRAAGVLPAPGPVNGPSPRVPPDLRGPPTVKRPDFAGGHFA